jgi:hypothetical protein
MNTPHKIFSGNALRDKLIESIPSASNLTIISAYITTPAIEWIVEYIKPTCSVTVVGRLLPNDFISGGSDFTAVKLALSNGWDIRWLAALHAKIYLCDRDRIFVGSANFTTKGLKLSGHGNLEGCIEVPPELDNIHFVERIVREAQPITYETVEKMERFINESSNDLLCMTKKNTNWPDYIVPRELSIWVYDFPWTNPYRQSGFTDEDIKHDIDILCISDLSNESVIADSFKKTKAFNWLLKKLEEPESKELYFGELTKTLHNELRDDPAPYRRDVKILLSNLLAYCQKYANDSIKIERPRYSQKIKLLVKH